MKFTLFGPLILAVACASPGKGYCAPKVKQEQVVFMCKKVLR